MIALTDSPCARLAADAFAFVDGELPLAAAADVTLHVAGCAGCRSRVVAAERLVRRVRATRERIVAPPTLHARAKAMFASWQMRAPRPT